MPARITRFCKIRNLIVHISRFRKHLLGQLGHPVHFILRRQRHRLHSRLLLDRVKLIQIVKWRPLLNDQGIGGNMLRFQPQKLLQGAGKTLCRLSRKRTHNIHIDIVESVFARQLVSLQELVKRVNPPENL